MAGPVLAPAPASGNGPRIFRNRSPPSTVLPTIFILDQLIESYDFMDGGKTSKRTPGVFYLREGLKWSDGMPYTADDMLFWHEA